MTRRNPEPPEALAARAKAFRDRMKDAGMVKVSEYVPKARADEARRVLKEMREGA